MKGRAIIPLAVGLAIGVFAIKYFVNVVKKAKGASTDVVQVVCANSDIAPTQEIKEAMLDVKEVAKAVAPKMYISDKQEIVGRVSGQQILTGMPIVVSLLAPKGTPAGLPVRIPAGFRAVAVPVDESQGVAGWLRPGSFVDVTAVMTSRGHGGTESISKVILQNIEVLAVGQDIASKTDGTASVAKTVTLAVKFEDVSTLDLAVTKGKIRLAMRNPNDDDTNKRGKEASDNDLVGDPTKKPAGFSSLLAGLVANLPKKDDNPTDKTARATEQPTEETVARVVPQPPAPRDWVQVYVGSEFREELGFAREENGWRLVSTKGKDELKEDTNGSKGSGLGARRSAIQPLPSPLQSR